MGWGGFSLISGSLLQISSSWCATFNCYIVYMHKFKILQFVDQVFFNLQVFKVWFSGTLLLGPILSNVDGT